MGEPGAVRTGVVGVAGLAQRVMHAWQPWFELAVIKRLLRHALLLTSVATVIGFGIVGLATEERIVATLAEQREDGTARLLHAAGSAASFTTVFCLGALASVWSRWRSGTWWFGQLLVVAGFGALLIVGIVKLLTARARPSEAMYDALTLAYPSGHGARAVVIAGLLAWLATRGAPTTRKALAWALAAVVVVVIGVSRIYLGMHWPSDVVVGYLIGAGWLGLVIPVARERLGAIEVATETAAPSRPAPRRRSRWSHGRRPRVRRGATGSSVHRGRAGGTRLSRRGAGPVA